MASLRQTNKAEHSMSFLFRTLCAVIGAAFLFAVANLAISGLPERGQAMEVASNESAPAPNPAPNPGSLLDLATSLLGIASSQPIEAPLAVTPIRAMPVAPAAPATALASEIEADWRAWMATHGLSDGAMVVLYPDGTMHRAALERASDASFPVASLSKAITGICMDVVLQEQGLSWYTTLGDIAPQMSQVRVTPQPWNARISLASLANHTSGLAPDLTQGTMGNVLHGALGLHRRIASEALREENMQGTPREFFYNNTNYAVLGVAIEALTGQSYSEACMARAMTPAGITDATIHGRMGSRSSYGGWEMSAESYARLAQHWFTNGAGLVGRPFDRPMHANYSLGYEIRDRGTSAQVSHAGYFCEGDNSGTGAYFHARGDGVVFSANWSGSCAAAGDTGLGQIIAGRM
ncbi:beta-lactamase family protein [Rhodobacteraceae bacterium N5(2021)]|uniref:Beta-lactamase family protein n=2 Tax=Gymnodinialimonas phycosphaerae TaxID=2841589 RepID=A0ABS7MS48_9RHOB|nr:beta-lactamase family protein [Gymnodinialimonas phycosphaerae]